MDDNGSAVFWQFELYLFQYIQQSTDETYCRIFWFEATGFHIVADCTCFLTFATRVCGISLIVFNVFIINHNKRALRGGGCQGVIALRVKDLRPL